MTQAVPSVITSIADLTTEQIERLPRHTSASEALVKFIEHTFMRMQAETEKNHVNIDYVFVINATDYAKVANFIQAMRSCLSRLRAKMERSKTPHTHFKMRRIDAKIDSPFAGQAILILRREYERDVADMSKQLKEMM